MAAASTPTYAGRATRAIGNDALRAGITATVFVHGSNSKKATIYSSRLRAALANPMPTNVAPGTPGIDSTGTALFFAEPGATVDLQLRDASNSTELFSIPVPFDTDEPSSLTLRYRGPYSAASVSYSAGDLVTASGSLFLCTVSHVSSTASPDPTKFNA